MHDQEPNKTKDKPVLHIVLDSNFVYRSTGKFLVKNEVSTLIKLKDEHPDLDVIWYLPETVRCEREYQIVKSALKHLSEVRSLEEYLGRKIEIEPEHVKEAVHSERQTDQ